MFDINSLRVRINWKKVSRLRLRKPQHHFLSFNSSDLRLYMFLLRFSIKNSTVSKSISENLDNLDLHCQNKIWSLFQSISKNKMVFTVEKKKCLKNVKTFLKSQSLSILTVFGREVQAYKLPSMYGGLFRMHK
jgi:hypothetical protein